MKRCVGKGMSLNVFAFSQYPYSRVPITVIPLVLVLSGFFCWLIRQQDLLQWLLFGGSGAASPCCLPADPHPRA